MQRLLPNPTANWCCQSGTGGSLSATARAYSNSQAPESVERPTDFVSLPD